MLEGLPGPGEIVAGKYRVDKVLGIGGMGVVLEAFHQGLGQRVAIKCLPGDAAEDHKRIARFKREAWTAAKLQNEHIVRVTDVGELDDGGAFMVMEYLEGEDLEAIARRGPLDVPTAVDYILQASEAMAEAHKAGIIHRDLKPGNLFLTRRGDGSPLLKVLDFGISKVAEGGLTNTRSLMGSPLYMAPEQLRSAKYVDPRSDIWSLGVILYELVTGTTPYAGDTLPEICTKILHDPPTPITQQGADLPHGLEAVIGRWLQKDPNKRFQNLAQVGNAVAPFGSASAKASAEFIRKVLGDDFGEKTLPIASKRSAPRGAFADDEVTQLRPTPAPAAPQPMRVTQPSQPHLGSQPALGHATEQHAAPYPHQHAHQQSNVAMRVGSGTVPSSPDLMARVGVTTAGPVSHSSMPEHAPSRTGLVLGVVAAAAALVFGVIVLSLIAGDESTGPAAAEAPRSETRAEPTESKRKEGEEPTTALDPKPVDAAGSADTPEPAPSASSSPSASASAPVAAPAPRPWRRPRPRPSQVDPYNRR